jgi:hypothetical protein
MTAMTTTSQPDLTTREAQRDHYAAIRQRLGIRVYTPVVPVTRIPPPALPPPSPEPVTRAVEYKRRRAKKAKRLLEMMAEVATRPSTATKYNRIVIEVAERHALPYNFMTTRVRLDEAIIARGECYYLLKVAGYSYSQIGMRAGRDHTTVINGVKRHCERTGLKYPT